MSRRLTQIWTLDGPATTADGRNLGEPRIGNLAVISARAPSGGAQAAREHVGPARIPGVAGAGPCGS